MDKKQIDNIMTKISKQLKEDEQPLTELQEETIKHELMGVTKK